MKGRKNMRSTSASLLQLTNILRDIKTDAAKGRIYLPLEDLAQFGYTEEELLGGDVQSAIHPSDEI